MAGETSTTPSLSCNGGGGAGFGGGFDMVNPSNSAATATTLHTTNDNSSAAAGGTCAVSALPSSPDSTMKSSNRFVRWTTTAAAVALEGLASSSSSPSSSTFLSELWTSAEILFSNRVTWLLLLGPLALVGDASNLLSEFICFILAGVALIPCAERLSFVTEQVAAHTNGTIGGLLNATFGNAPEFLISTAALRNGFYRVVQLTLLGSVLTNLLFVFGLSCLIGGLRWQVQELRITSGNVSVGMLLVATTGLLLPAALKMSGEILVSTDTNDGDANDEAEENVGPVVDRELAFSRWNALLMMIMYVGYLTFQLGTHKEEFDEDCSIIESGVAFSPSFTARQQKKKKKARRNKFCLHYYPYSTVDTDSDDHSSHRVCGRDVLLGAKAIEISQLELSKRPSEEAPFLNGDDDEHSSLSSSSHSITTSDDPAVGAASDPQFRRTPSGHFDFSSPSSGHNLQYHTPNLSSWKKWNSRRKSPPSSRSLPGSSPHDHRSGRRRSGKRLRSRKKELIPQSFNDADNELSDDGKGRSFGGLHYDGVTRKSHDSLELHRDSHFPPNLSFPAVTPCKAGQMSFRTGIVWLLVITLFISAISDILVDTIDGFAHKCHISEVFTSMIILPYFSNIAEQVSAVIFAYRNEMDLCIGITVGSAIQIALFVLPGCTLIGWVMDRSMSLFFRGFETCCLILGVLCVSAVLQGGTTNWLVGMFFICIYLMIALGFWFHELEDLSTDQEKSLQNITSESN